MKILLKTAPLCLALFAPSVQVQAKAADAGIASPDTANQRTVMNTEYGSIFAKPNGFPYSDFGVYIGASWYSTNLNPDAIKGKYSHFNHFGPADALIGFPYTALRQYEASEVKAGRNPIFVTATYKGKKRPVLYVDYLGLKNNKPTTSSNTWVYAVNVQDLRFINWWIDNYARPVVLNPMIPLKNAWVYVDGCAFNYASYGVIDDNDNFVAGVAWDSPFPSTPNSYLTSIATFFNTLHQIAPDINVMADTGSMSDPNQFSTVYANVAGALEEDVYGWHSNPSSWVVNHWYTTTIPWFSWLGAQGKVGVMGAFLPVNYESGALLVSFAFYELVKGPNFFFAPRVGGTAIPLTAGWLDWNTKLGLPVSAFQSTQQAGQSAGHCLFSRAYTNGYVYLNWTGVTQTVTLPTGSTWLDPNGNKVTTLTIPTWTGTFVNR